MLQNSHLIRKSSIAGKSVSIFMSRMPDGAHYYYLESVPEELTKGIHGSFNLEKVYDKFLEVRKFIVD